LNWEAAATISYSGDCSLRIVTTGVPPNHAAYYLAPVSTEFPTAVAVCPTKAAATTSTNAGAIGLKLSGEALFNPYEGNGEDAPAMSDNVSYTFNDSSGSS
jgi:hypothetical protein